MSEFKTGVKCDYRLHKKYEGITLKYNGVRIRNADLTNELAKELIAKHPHGVKLFDIIPKEIEVKEIEVVEEIKVVPKRKRKNKK